MKITKKSKAILSCPFHLGTEVVEHQITEKQKYKVKLNELNEAVYELDKQGNRIPLPREITKGKHCPKCFVNNGFVEAENIGGKWIVISK
jgi:hypothetical protein